MVECLANMLKTLRLIMVTAKQSPHTQAGLKPIMKVLWNCWVSLRHPVTVVDLFITMYSHMVP